jgi:hypothetical protein
MALQFKQLDIKPEGNWIQRNLLTPHAKKTMVAILIGAVAALVVTLVTDEKAIAELSTGDIFQSIFVGGFFGFFITNSPCARGRC